MLSLGLLKFAFMKLLVKAFSIEAIKLWFFYRISEYRWLSSIISSSDWWYWTPNVMQYLDIKQLIIVLVNIA